MRAHPTILGLLALLCAACSGAASRPAATPPAPPPVVEVRVPGPAQIAAAPEATGQPIEEPRAAPFAEPLTACLAELRDGQYVERAHPRAPGRDGYAAGLAQELAGKPEEAHKAYLLVIRDEPTSPYIPLTYLAFGELLFHAAEADPSKLSFARQAYERVVRYPLPENAAALYAHHQLAQIDLRGQDFQRALEASMKVLVAAATFPALPCAGELAGRARRDLVTAYAAAGKPDRALVFFRTLSPREGTDASAALDMLGSLAEAYVDSDRPAEAVAALLSAPAGAAPEPFCLREAAVLRKLAAAARGPKPEHRINELAQAHARRCAR